MRLLLIIVVGVVLLGCGDGTLGPLGGEGFAARETLRVRVDQIRGYRSADDRPLDALVVITASYTGGDTGAAYTTNIETSMVSEQGRIDAPIVGINGQLSEVFYSGYAEYSAKLTDTLLTIGLTWPDTTLMIAHRMHRWETIGGDTFTYKRTWSLAERGSIDLVGLRTDSIMTTFTQIIDMAQFGVYDRHIQVDAGVIEFTPFLAKYVVSGQTYLAECYRSFYRVYEIPSPTSSTGPRLIGVMQQHRIPVLINVTD